MYHKVMLYLHHRKDQERPLFLVGHSYGGTVISWVCYYCCYKTTYLLMS